MLFKEFVLDCSLTMTWCFPDEATSYTLAVQEMLLDTNAIVPAIWPFEVANVLCLAEQKKRITKAQSRYFKMLLMACSIVIDDCLPTNIFGDTLDVAKQQNLTVYDAAYLELAMRKGLPLATLDKQLRDAANAVGVSLVKIIDKSKK